MKNPPDCKEGGGSWEENRGGLLAVLEFCMLGGGGNWVEEGPEGKKELELNN